MFRTTILVSILILGGCSPTTTLSEAERSAAWASLESQSPLDLAHRIDEVLARERQHRQLDASVNAAWQIMHGVVCYGDQLKIQTSDRGVVGAIEYAFSGGQINGFELKLGHQPLPATGRTGVVARVEPGSYVGQGHPDQWLAVCAMSDLPATTEVRVGDETRTLLDWAYQVQYDVPNNVMDEYSWTLIALTHYLPEQASWHTEGEGLASWEMLVEAELSYAIEDSACGGTHRLAGIVRALRAKAALGLPDTPVWQEAQALVEECLENAKANRSPNGAFSSYYFVRPAQSVDVAAELASSGHVFEFVALALPREELNASWITIAGTRICDLLDMAETADVDCGALYHALNGLKIYRQRLSNLDTP